MRINPGGQLAPNEVVGRDRFIGDLWDTLEAQSVVLSAERRLGKTCVVKKMQAEPRPGFRPLYRDLEGVSSPLEFAQRVAADVVPLLGATARTGLRLHALLERLGVGEIGAGGLIVRLPDTHASQWKALLESAIGDACERTDDMLVFFWDEVPLMIQKLAVTSPRDAMEVLDVLRSLARPIRACAWSTPVRSACTGCSRGFAAPVTPTRLSTT